MSQFNRIGSLILATAMAVSAIAVDGVVRDQTGQPVQGAVVTFASEDDPNLSVSGTTGADGNYQVDLSTPQVTAVLGITEVPEASALFQNYPNPFNPETIIAFQIEQATDVRLVVYNSLGQRVRTLVQAPMEAGLHRLNWDASDDAGRGVAAGTYFYQLTTDRLIDTGKMTLVDGHKGHVSSRNSELSPLAGRVPEPAGKALEEAQFFTISVTGDGFFDYSRSGVSIDEDRSVDMLVNSSSDLGMVRLGLTDAPIDEADAVLITINTVDIRRAGGGPWQTFVGESRTFDLLSLTGGVNEMLGEQVLEPGEFTGIRLLVEAAQIVIDGETFDLEVPSGDQRGIQLQGSFSIVTGETLDLMMDFDARKSITRRGQGNNFALKPIVRLVPTTGAGFITGRVFADGGEDGLQAVVIAKQDGEEISSAIVDPEDGTYRIAYLEPGAYDLHVESELTIEPGIVEGVEVRARRGTRRVDFGERSEDDDTDDGDDAEDDGDHTDDGDDAEDDGDDTDDGDDAEDDGDGTDDGDDAEDDGDGTDDGDDAEDDGEGTDDGDDAEDDGDGTDDGDDAVTEEALSLANVEDAWAIALNMLTRVVTEAVESGATTVAGEVDGEATVTTSVGLSGITYVVDFDAMSDAADASISGEITINTTDGEQFDYKGELEFAGALVGEMAIDMSGTTDGTSGTLSVGDEELVVE